MLNRHKNWLVHKQTACGKDFSNPFMVDNLPKIVGFSTHLASLVKSWLVQDQTVLALASPKANELTIPEQTATGKGTSNPLMAGSLPKTTKPTSVEIEFPAITFNDEVSSKTLSYEPTVSSLNDEIDFRISFDDSDDEDYTVIFEKNSYKFFSTNDLKTDLENDNEKVIPSLPSPKPAISCFDDLDFCKDFENEFPAIVYNDAQTSKSNLSTEPIFNPQHIDELDLNDNMSLSKYDEEEQNVLYFNDLFPFNIVLLDDLKSEKDNDDNDIDIIQSSEDMAPLPPREQRHPSLRYQGLEYSNADIGDFEERLERIYSGARRYLSSKQFILALGLHTEEEMESLSFAWYWSEKILRELTVIAPELPIIDMAKLVRLQIYVQLDDTWVWVAMGPERQPDATASALIVVEDAPAIDEGDQAVPAPVQAP
ncbi:hypothetical protein Tco_0991226 [Tanacetum coccineum]|uniref:Uncharacterized protein n=1 Tax=Tanacetum coccineum TaxID=301880 RepID=A0ABQ5F0C7_9ASTR